MSGSGFRVLLKIRTAASGSSFKVFFQNRPGYYSTYGTGFRVLFKTRSAASASGFSVLFKIRAAASGLLFRVRFKNGQDILQRMVLYSGYY